MRAPGILRGLLLLSLAGALVFTLVRGPAAPPGMPLVLTEETTLEATVRALSQGVPPSRVLRRTGSPPTLEESELLSGAATFAPVTAALPRDEPRIIPVPPEGLVQGRTAALVFHLVGDAGARMPVYLEGDGGSVDTAEVTLGPDGAGEGFFRIRPAREGWYEWRLTTGESGAEESASAPLGAWVREAEPLRVLVLGGAPTWESRFLVRALEESGASVAVHQDVGRELAVTAVVDRPPLTVEELEGFDALLLLSGAPLGPRRSDAIESWVTERGGGVAIAGAGEEGDEVGAGTAEGGMLARLGLAEGSAPGGDRMATDVRWNLPPEIAPLPADPISSSLRVFRDPRPGAVAGATVGEEASPALLLSVAGRGRAAAVGFRESWRWRMEAGRVAEHRELWRTLAEWLSGGLREEWRVVPDRNRVPTGSAVSVHVTVVEGREPEAAALPRLTLFAPETERELYVESDGRAHFIASEPGIHAVAHGDGSSTAAVRAGEGAEEHPSARARLARSAYASGAEGGVVDVDSARILAASFRTPGASFGSVFVLLFGLLVLLPLIEWTLRRLRGMH